VLLARPGVEVPALALAGGESGLAPSSEASLLDERALRSYRQRITDLQADIDEAAAHHDLERAARAEAELDALVEHLTTASGLGGRKRRFSGPDERARVSVTKALRSALANVGEHLPELGAHLTATVHTGHRCVYRPDPRAAEPWETEHR
jgi:hypothetical protein